MNIVEQNNNILIIDDNIKNVQVIGALVREMGVPFNIAQSGKQALEILKTVTPVLILCDIMMPEMSGFEFCQIIKKGENTKDIPLIFLTASNDEEDESRGLELGAVDFIRKPINPPVLKARVNTQLKLQRTLNALQNALESVESQNSLLQENSRLKEEVERISRHDLKNPLQAVIAIPDLLIMQGNMNEEQTSLLEELKQTGFDMLSMIDSSLDIYKMEMKTYSVEYDPVNIVRTCYQIRNEMSQMIIKKNINFQIHCNCSSVIKSDEFYIESEELLIYSMLSNIVKNAVEASPDNDSIIINLWNKVSLVSISVENSGHIPDSIKSTFFDKYATFGKKKGTGLGTYSAKLIAETLNGSIALDISTLGIVRVVIELPKSE